MAGRIHKDIMTSIRNKNKPIFKRAETNAQLRANKIYRYIRPVFLGLYIYLAILICFSPLFQIAWTVLFTHIPKMRSTSWESLADTFGKLNIFLANPMNTFNLSSIRQNLNTLFSLPSLRLSPGINGLAIGLLLPIGLLGIIALVHNAWIALSTRGYSSRSAKGIRLIRALLLYPLLAFAILKCIALFLQDAQSVMVLLIILSLLSFSLLKRI